MSSDGVAAKAATDTAATGQHGCKRSALQWYTHVCMFVTALGQPRTSAPEALGLHAAHPLSSRHRRHRCCLSKGCISSAHYTTTDVRRQWHCLYYNVILGLSRTSAPAAPRCSEVLQQISPHLHHRCRFQKSCPTYRHHSESCASACHTTTSLEPLLRVNHRLLAATYTSCCSVVLSRSAIPICSAPAKLILLNQRLHHTQAPQTPGKSSVRELYIYHGTIVATSATDAAYHNLSSVVLWRSAAARCSAPPSPILQHSSLHRTRTPQRPDKTANCATHP